MEFFSVEEIEVLNVEIALAETERGRVRGSAWRTCRVKDWSPSLADIDERFGVVASCPLEDESLK